MAKGVLDIDVLKMTGDMSPVCWALSLTFARALQLLKPLQSALYLSTTRFTGEKAFLTVLCELMGPHINFNNDV